MVGLNPEVSISPRVVSRRISVTLSWRAAVGLACCCALFGVFSLYNTAMWLAGVWRTDDLKSVGLVVPFVSFALILRAWRTIGWETEGTWWGFAVLFVTALLVFLRDQTMLVLTVHKDWLLQLPPVPSLAILYALGMVLLFGGARLLRAAWFPVLFLGLVLPVPETFSRVVDLPLQHASATVARGFAHLLGEPLTADRLRLMFTPEFGMFIAPGCNGIRGAVTLGLAAVVMAYLYRFRAWVAVPVVAGAVLLGYVFNLLRLCLLVVYYKMALPYPWLQERAKGADYLIGGGLFILALLLFFGVADRLRRGPALPEESAASREALAGVSSSLWVRAGALFFGLDSLRAERREEAHFAVLPAMPARLGTYRLVRTWQDTLTTGAVVYTWGEYAPGEGMGGVPVAVGVSPELDMHDAEVCHMARGEEPVWHGELRTASPGGPVTLVGAVYNDGLGQTLEASTVCADRRGWMVWRTGWLSGFGVPCVHKAATLGR